MTRPRQVSGRRGARGIDGGESTLVVSHEAMLDAAGKVAADDIGLRADTYDKSARGARGIDGGEGALVRQEGMGRLGGDAGLAAYEPAISPRGLIPKTLVDPAPGKSMVVKTP